MALKAASTPRAEAPFAYESRGKYPVPRLGGMIMRSDVGRPLLIHTGGWAYFSRCAKFAAVLMVSMFASGCASDQATRIYAPNKYAPRIASEVEILSQPPSSTYEVLADFQSRGESRSDMQRRAAEVGADAVIVVFVGGQRARSDEKAGEDTYAGTYSRVVGTAIKYTK